jgi:hypothetical protein
MPDQSTPQWVRRPSRLLSLPEELLENIALHCARSPFYGPPAHIVPLLLTCRKLHDALAFGSDPHLYARIFKVKFDHSAASRRLGPERVNVVAFAEELKRRCIAMKRMRTAVQETKHENHQAAEFLTEDLWMSFLMCLESDGKNLAQLLRYVNLDDYIRAYVTRFMEPRTSIPSYPPETTDASLVLWLSWFLSHALVKENFFSQKFSSFQMVIRPYVFAAFKFDAYLAPWTKFDLPMTSSSDSTLNTPATDPYAADLAPRDRTQTIWAYNGPLKIATPLLAQAAILNFAVALEVDPYFENPNGLSALAFAAQMPRPTRATPNVRSSLPELRNSKLYDRDFRRLMSCLDPARSPCQPHLIQPGMIAGSWEGRFGFIDFDHYSDMLSGDSELAYRGFIGHQSQVWRITEHHLVPPKGKNRAKIQNLQSKDKDAPPQPTEKFEPVPVGPATRGYVPHPIHIQEEQGGIRVEAPEGAPGVFYKTWTELADGSQGFEPTHHEDDFDFDSEWVDPYGWDGWDSPDKEAEETDNTKANPDGDENEPAIGDIILTGGGHSAWGSFQLRGRVRPWDGLVTLLKEYPGTTGRGEWLYRGYVLGDGTWVGRWRDTYTQEHLCGYEGFFTMTRRQ